MKDNHPLVLVNGISNNFFLEASRGNISGVSVIHLFGHNLSVGSTNETLWIEGGIYVYPPSASIMTLSSANVIDTSDGDGARTVIVGGLNALYDSVSETLTLNGQTGVSTVNEYIRINDFTVITAGADGKNAGKLYIGSGTITTGVPANKYSVIDIGDNIANQLICSTPRNMKSFLISYSVSVPSAKDLMTLIMHRNFGEVFHNDDMVHLFQAPFLRDFIIPKKFDGKSDMEIRANISASTGQVGATLDILMIDDNVYDSFNN